MKISYEVVKNNDRRTIISVTAGDLKFAMSVPSNAMESEDMLQAAIIKRVQSRLAMAKNPPSPPVPPEAKPFLANGFKASIDTAAQLGKLASAATVELAKVQ